MEAGAPVAVVGAGSWGTTVASLVARHRPVTLWARDPVLARVIDDEHENPRYLAGVTLPSSVRATPDLTAAVSGAEVVVMGVPSHGFRDVLVDLVAALRADAIVVSLTKGIERGTMLRMTEVVIDTVPGIDAARVAALSGPNLALEVAAGQPAASVVACADLETAELLQQLVMTETFRVYTNPDVVGVEIAAACKNVIAIAAGTAAGLGFGDNTQAAIITRGLAELTRLGVSLGGEPLTFAGLAGLGDLVATCTSEKSRNRTVGVELGRGRELGEIVASSTMVAEGVRSVSGVLALAARQGVEMPIATMVDQVLSHGHRPADLVSTLMAREAKPELHGLR